MIITISFSEGEIKIMPMIFNDDSKFGSPIEVNTHDKKEGSIYQLILTKYGIDAQLSHFAQEFAEAHVELVKNIRGDENDHDALEELAHLMIMTRQMIAYIDPGMHTYPEVYADELGRARRLVE